MATEVLFKYPYNPSGDNPKCVVTEEVVLSVYKGDFLFVVPAQSPFFKEDLAVFSIEENKTLSVDKDYKLTHQFKSATDALKKDIYGSITFINKELKGRIRLVYSTLGGDFTYRDKDALDGLVRVLTSQRNVLWDDIVSKPAEFTPEAHLHTSEEVVGMDDVVESLDNIAEIISGETHPSHRHKMNSIDGLEEAVKGMVSNDGYIKYNTFISPWFTDDNTKVLAIKLPEFKSPSDRMEFIMEFMIYSYSRIEKINVFGTIQNNKAQGDSWLMLNVFSTNDLYTRKVSGTYDVNGRALLLLESVPDKWISCRFTGIKTIYSRWDNITIEGNYEFEWATTLVGKIVDVEKIALDSDLKALEDDIDKKLEQIRKEIDESLDESKKLIDELRAEMNALPFKRIKIDLVDSSGTMDMFYVLCPLVSNGFTGRIVTSRRTGNTISDSMDIQAVSRVGDPEGGSFHLKWDITQSETEREIVELEYKGVTHLAVRVIDNRQHYRPNSGLFYNAADNDFIPIAVLQNHDDVGDFEKINRVHSSWSDCWGYSNFKVPELISKISQSTNKASLTRRDFVEEGLDLKFDKTGGTLTGNVRFTKKGEGIFFPNNMALRSAGNADNMLIFIAGKDGKVRVVTKTLHITDDVNSDGGTVYHTLNKPSKSDVGLGNVDNVKQVALNGVNRLQRAISFTVDGNNSVDGDEGRGVFRIVPSANSTHGSKGTVHIQSGEAGASGAISSSGALSFNGYYGGPLKALLIRVENNKDFFVVVGSNSKEYPVYHEGNKPSKSDVGLGNVDNVKQYPNTGGVLNGNLILEGSSRSIACRNYRSSAGYSLHINPSNADKNTYINWYAGNFLYVGNGKEATILVINNNNKTSTFTGPVIISNNTIYPDVPLIKAEEPPSKWKNGISISRGTGADGYSPYAPLQTLKAKDNRYISQSFIYRSGSAAHMKFRTANEEGDDWTDWFQVYTTAYRPYADRWTAARKVTLKGDVSGEFNIRGDANVEAEVKVDKVDGINIENFIYGDNGSGAIYENDFNKAWKSGFYRATNPENGPIENPIGGWFWYINSGFNHNNGYGLQLAGENSGNSSRYWLRSTGIDGVGRWVEIYTTRNKPSAEDLNFLPIFNNALSNDIDLNTLIKGAIHYQPTSSNASLNNNYPVEKAGQLLTINHLSDNSQSAQIYIDVDGKVFSRSRTGGTNPAWTNWSKLVGASILEPDNVDFNDFTTTDSHSIGSISSSKNKPPLSHCLLQVIGNPKGNYVLQTAVERTTNKFYLRTYHRAENDWTDWIKVYHEKQKPSKADVGLGNVDNVKQLPFTGGTLNHRSGYLSIFRYNEETHGDKEFKDGYIRLFTTFTTIENRAVLIADVRSNELGNDTPSRLIDIRLAGHYVYHTGRKPSKADVGLGNVDNVKQVPSTRTVNSKELSANISLNAGDVGARANNWVPTWNDVSSKPAQATRWPNHSEVTDKPAQATRWPKWDEVTDKPAQATRWPKWGEVTEKPSSFPPASHNHDSAYLKLSGGTLTGDLTGRNIKVSGTVTADADVRVSSDKRLKENIKPIGETSSDICKLEGIVYTLKSDPERRKFLGLIAQDVAEHFPETVSESDDGYLTISYHQLIAPMIETIKGLNERVEALEKTVYTLSTKK